MGYNRSVAASVTQANKSAFEFQSFAGIENIKKDENSIRSLKREVGILYDKNGNTVVISHGGSVSVNITSTQMLRAEGGVFTHNHPGGGTFSPADVNSLRRSFLAEIRAVAPEGTYVLARPIVWPKELLTKEDIKREFMRYFDEGDAALSNVVRAHSAFEQFALNYGLNYRLE